MIGPDVKSTNPTVQEYSVLAPRGQSRALSRFYVSFGGGLKLVGEDWMINELRALGLTRRSFRQLCRNLGVPLVRVGKGACVDFWAFVVALKAVTRGGQPDFVIPGAHMSHGWEDARHQISADEVEKERAAIVREIVESRSMSGLVTPRQMSDNLETAVDRIRETRSRLRD